MNARLLAWSALVRIDRDGAYANLVLPTLLATSGLDERDRAYATELTYGTTRMRRACDWLVDRFLADDRLDVEVRSALRLGAYDLAFLGTPAHAAVSQAVGLAPRRARGLVNAVLRKVALDPAGWPTDAIRLSYPDWIVDRLVSDLGVESAMATLEVMNRAPVVSRRADGYTQDLGSQHVVEAVGAQSGERVLDLCAAPGGKATGMASAGAFVVAGDLRHRRLSLVDENRCRLGLRDNVALLVADATAPPLRSGSFDRVLVDAPCSGLGALRRRPDARWRIEETDLVGLSALQTRLLLAAARLVRPGGELIYSVCTLTRIEGPDVDRRVRAEVETLVPLPVEPPWEPWEGGGRLLPAQTDSDGMVMFRYRVSG